MEYITVNLITNKQQEIQRFLRKYFSDDSFSLEDRTFRFSFVFHSAVQALDLVTIAAEADDEYLIQIVVNLPEFNAVITKKNLEAFIKYIYYRESCT